MKIDPNISTNFGQQDLGTTPAGSAQPAVDTDRLEGFAETNALFGTGVEQGGQVPRDTSFAASLALGTRNESFGLPLIKDPNSPPPDDGVNWDDDIYIQDWAWDAATWLGQQLMKAPELGEWLLDGIKSGAEASVGAVFEAGKAVAEGASWVSGELYEGASAVASGIADAAGAVGDAISDALDW
jgi:hypothetical protein